MPIYWSKTFGHGKEERFPGHQIVEIGLAKLYRVTGKQEYLDLAKFFLDVRGPGKRHSGQYNQSHKNSFQYMVHADGSWGFTSAPKGSRGQAIFEMTSQFMLWQVYPEWMTFENYHLKDFLKNTHYAFLHEINQYHSPFVLEYWASLHGK